MSQANLRENFETLCRAIYSRDAALLECTGITTGEKLSLICAVNRLENGFVEFVPLAQMLEARMHEVVVDAALQPPGVNPELN